MTKRTLKRWKFLLWEALKKHVRERVGWCCQRCGKYKEPHVLHTHHLVPKSRGLYARFEPDNLVALCYYCHHNFWHGDSTWDEQRDLIERWIGLERYEEIRREAKKSHKYREEDYERMLKELTDDSTEQ